MIVNCARSTIDDHDEKEKEVFFGPTTSQLIWCHDSATIYHADFCCNAAVNRTVLPPLAFSIVVFAMALVGEAPSLRDGDDATTAQCLLGKTATLSLSLCPSVDVDGIASNSGRGSSFVCWQTSFDESHFVLRFSCKDGRRGVSVFGIYFFV